MLVVTFLVWALGDMDVPLWWWCIALLLDYNSVGKGRT